MNISQITQLVKDAGETFLQSRDPSNDPTLNYNHFDGDGFSNAISKWILMIISEVVIQLKKYIDIKIQEQNDFIKKEIKRDKQLSMLEKGTLEDIHHEYNVKSSNQNAARHSTKILEDSHNRNKKGFSDISKAPHIHAKTCNAATKVPRSEMSSQCGTSSWTEFPLHRFWSSRTNYRNLRAPYFKWPLRKSSRTLPLLHKGISHAVLSGSSATETVLGSISYNSSGGRTATLFHPISGESRVREATTTANLKCSTTTKKDCSVSSSVSMDTDWKNCPRNMSCVAEKELSKDGHGMEYESSESQLYLAENFTRDIDFMKNAHGPILREPQNDLFNLMNSRDEKIENEKANAMEIKEEPFILPKEKQHIDYDAIKEDSNSPSHYNDKDFFSINIDENINLDIGTEMPHPQLEDVSNDSCSIKEEIDLYCIPPSIEEIQQNHATLQPSIWNCDENNQNIQFKRNGDQMIIEIKFEMESDDENPGNQNPECYSCGIKNRNPNEIIQRLQHEVPKEREFDRELNEVLKIKTPNELKCNFLPKEPDLIVNKDLQPSPVSVQDNQDVLRNEHEHCHLLRPFNTENNISVEDQAIYFDNANFQSTDLDDCEDGNNQPQNKHSAYISHIGSLNSHNTGNISELQREILKYIPNFDTDISSKALDTSKPQTNALNHSKYLPYMKMIVDSRDSINCPLCGICFNQLQTLKKHILGKHSNFLMFRAKHEGIVDGEYDKIDIALQYTYIDIIHKDFSLSETMIKNFVKRKKIEFNIVPKPPDLNVNKDNQPSPISEQDNQELLRPCNRENNLSVGKVNINDLSILEDQVIYFDNANFQSTDLDDCEDGSDQPKNKHSAYISHIGSLNAHNTGKNSELQRGTLKYEPNFDTDISKTSDTSKPQTYALNHSEYLPFMKMIRAEFRTVGPRDSINCPLCGIFMSASQHLKKHLLGLHHNFLMFRAKQEGIVDGEYGKIGNALRYTFIDIIHTDFSLSETLIIKFIQSKELKFENCDFWTKNSTWETKNRAGNET